MFEEYEDALRFYVSPWAGKVAMGSRHCRLKLVSARTRKGPASWVVPLPRPPKTLVCSRLKKKRGRK